MLIEMAISHIGVYGFHTLLLFQFPVNEVPAGNSNGRSNWDLATKWENGVKLLCPSLTSCHHRLLQNEAEDGSLLIVFLCVPVLSYKNKFKHLKIKFKHKTVTPIQMLNLALRIIHCWFPHRVLLWLCLVDSSRFPKSQCTHWKRRKCV